MNPTYNYVMSFVGWSTLKQLDDIGWAGLGGPDEELSTFFLFLSYITGHWGQALVQW